MFCRVKLIIYILQEAVFLVVAILLAQNHLTVMIKDNASVSLE